MPGPTRIGVAKFSFALLPALCCIFVPFTHVFAQSERPSSSATPARVLYLGNQDYAWTGLGALSAIPAQLRFRAMDPVDTNALDRNHLWPMDRWAAGYYSPSAALTSDFLVAPLIGLPIAATALEALRGRQSWGSAFSDGVIFAEALVISSSLDLLVRSTAVHPRPFVYNRNTPASERLKSEAAGSFYSGHSNAAFLSAVYFSYTYSLRNPGSEHLGAVWAGTLGAAALVAGLRVTAGKHYLSDVAVGAAAGSFFGWVFPYMHKKRAGGSGDPGGLGLRLNGMGPYPLLTWTF
ncbi:MAG: phosphatase PAP2 family protein [Fibrobacteria bacterium]